ncbi:MAG: hypothetical protein QM770_00100 [Tepidisphaeraceae bacterium]
MTASERQPPAPIPAVLVSMVVWFIVVVAHFLVCAKLAHWLGSPNQLPPSLRSVDQVFSYGLSGALDLLVIVVWMAIVLGTLVGPCVVLSALASLLPDRLMSAVAEGMISLLPVAGLTVTVLLILPCYSHNAPLEPSGLELAESMSFGAYLETLYTGLFAIVDIVVLFGGLLVAATLFDKYMPNGGVWQLIVAILFGIVLAMVFAFLVGPLVLRLSERFGAVRAIVGFLGAWALLTSMPALLATRSSSSKPKKR